MMQPVPSSFCRVGPDSVAATSIHSKAIHASGLASCYTRSSVSLCSLSIRF